MDSIAPQWIVDHLEETLTFYVDLLGFQVEWKGDLFAIISKGKVTLMLRQLKSSNLKRPNRIPFLESGWHTKGPEAWDAYIWMEEVEDFYAEIKQKGVAVIKQLTHTDYGNLDFEIEDNNGYILCFGKRLG